MLYGRHISADIALAPSARCLTAPFFSTRSDTPNMPRAPWSAIPAARSSLPVLKIRLFLVLGSLLLAAALGIVSTVAWLTRPPAGGGGAPTPHALGFATTIATNYLTDHPVSLMNGIVSGLNPSLGHPTRPDFGLPVTSFAYDTFVTGPNPVYINGDFLETYYFDVETTRANYLLAVPVDVTPTGNSLAAYPTLLPYVNLSPSFPSGPPSTYGIYSATDNTSAGVIDYSHDTNPVGCSGCTNSLSTPVTSIISQWAADFTSNSSQAQADLQKNVVGDASASPGTYIGLSGINPLANSTYVTVVGGTQQTTTIGNTQVPVDIVHVTLLLTPTGAKGFTVSSDYDLLVIDPQTSTPHVVAWGPAGSGPTLVAYQNRI